VGSDRAPLAGGQGVSPGEGGDEASHSERCLVSFKPSKVYMRRKTAKGNPVNRAWGGALCSATGGFRNPPAKERKTGSLKLPASVPTPRAGSGSVTHPRASPLNRAPFPVSHILKN